MPTEHAERPLVADRYRLDSVIGSGGVGRVWRGEDTVLRRAVAIKEVPLPVHLADDERDALRSRVLREAQAAARIHHPGSVQVYDVVDEVDTVHLVMELVDDLTLAEVVENEGPLSAQATAAMGVELLGALAAAHRVGIVLRDVKPRNVMVIEKGGVKLADFGIATLRDDPSITKTGMVLGTPSYMSPEQALGEVVGPGTDVWGTGALLYFAVEGVAPFDRGEPIATLHAVVHGEPRPYERAGPLAAVIDQLLAKDPTARISLEDASDRLEAIAGGADGATQVMASTSATASTAISAPLATTATPTAASAAPPDPPPSPRTRQPDARRDASPSPNKTLPLVIAAVVAVLAIGAVALAAQDDGGGGEVAGTTETTPSTDVAPGADTTAPPSTGAPGAQPEVTAETTTTTVEEAPDEVASDRPEGVPASWVSYTDPTVGFAIWHPEDWTPTRGSGNGTDFTDPSSGSYLRVDYIQPPGDDPVEAWEESSDRFADRYPDYEELRIERTTYQGFDAALWEYTYEGQRATNLGFITPGTGFALNFQTSIDAWEARADVRRAFEAGFTAPG